MRGSTAGRVWAIAVLFVSIFCLLARARPALDVFKDCFNETNITSSCVWRTRATASFEIVIRGQWFAANGGFPVLMALGQERTDETSVSPVPGFTLTLKRLVLANVTLAKPATAGLPALWPLQLFTAPATSVSMLDVRMVISDADFKSYLTFFTADNATAAAVYHTDNRTFLHIASWASSNTRLQSVTLIAGSCRPSDPEVYADTQLALAAAPADALSSCAVRAENASTLVPMLLREASKATDQPLLVFIIANVTLGAGLGPGAIVIRRPVVFVGLATRPTSVDFGMVVNQLNVTDRYSKVFWLNLVLENVAPGDATSAVLAPPYSTAISQNIWAMYCNRTHNCLNLYNTTTVIATASELDYLAFMFSAYNSQLPSMQQITDFYHTDIMVEYIKFVPGPGDHAITILQMKSLAWVLEHNVMSSDPVVADKLPLPAGLAVTLQTARAGPLVQTVDSCEHLQAALRWPKEHTIKLGRQNVWMMLGNITVNPADDPTCWQDRELLFPTQLYGQRLHGNASGGVSAHNLADQTLPLGPGTARSGEGSSVVEGNSAGHAGPLDDKFALGFSFMQSALRLPEGVDDKFLQIQNMTLLQLPQGPYTAGAANLAAGQDGPTPPDVWTFLLWSIGRSLSSKPLYLVNVQLMVPQPEFDFLSNKARVARTFTLQLTGGASILATGAVAVDTALWFNTLQGPGLTADNVWLVPDPSAAGAMPDYTWPWGVPGPAARRQGELEAAVAASVAGGVLLSLAAGGVWWACRRRRAQQKSWRGGKDQLPVFAMPTDCIHCGKPSSASVEGGKGSEEAVGLPLFVDAGSKEEAPSRGRLFSAVTADNPVGQQGCKSSSQDGAAPLAGDASHCADSTVEIAELSLQESVAPEDSISSGLQRWRAAFNSTALHIMERRMSNLSVGSTKTPQSMCSSNMFQPSTPAMGAARIAQSRRRSSCTASQGYASAVVGNLQLQQLIGQGSFGGVYLGSWHGKRVAVKVMQLPASALLGPDTDACRTAKGRQQQKEQGQQDGLPHMAIMETVVSSTMSHPNVVQVYTYMINPLTVQADAASAAAGGCKPGEAAGRQEVDSSSKVSGWELRLVMEYCEQGSLREALSRATLQKEDTSSLSPAPSVALSLSHDVAAAMLHLHSEGVVHGDLKAANVLLTRGGEDPGNVWAATVGHRVTAKVADFGMALPLDPKETHATMSARGTPTHMSPELFMSGHVSKASDVYAYGIMLYEIITGQRAYAGVPIPLLPHEVARQGLRPTWPSGLSNSYRDLQRLAEACWAQQPQDRPTFVEVFTYLESCEKGTPATELLDRCHLRLQPTQQQQDVPEQSPRQRSAAAVVDWQLQELRHTAEQQLQVVQRSPRAAAGGPLPVALAVVNLGEVVWSGVSYAGVDADNTQLQDE